ncbi:MAG: DUF4192 family protein [Acidobacteria bacterium]|nr:DUF4192 family protein [Acidobacteriota bacterium]
MRDILLGQTKQPPHWRRVDRAADVLLNLYSKTDGPDSAPILTSLGVIHWWEGHGTKAHQCFQHALQADPQYRLAQLTDQLVTSGILADWTINRAAAYQPPHTRGPEAGGIDV